MTLVISTGVSLSSSWLFPADPDAAAYVAAVEAADGQTLETATKAAIDNFVIGCKADGIWDAIKASCIMAGARTLAGALVPLKGTAPTNFNFVAGDYNRKTGLKGNGSKYLNSNRAANDDPQNNHHLAIYATFAENRTEVRIGSQLSPWENSIVAIASGPTYMILRGPSDNTPIGYSVSNSANLTGFCGASRTGAAALYHRIGQITRGPFALTSQAVGAVNHYVFTRNVNGSSQFSATSRLSYYSIGESLDLALLDARVTGLMSDFAAVIP